MTLGQKLAAELVQGAEVSGEKQIQCGTHTNPNGKITTQIPHILEQGHVIYNK